MPTGTITRFFSKQGYGYITPDDNDGDYVVTVDQVADQSTLGIGEGRRVRFEEDEAAMGLRAANVIILDQPEVELLKH
ncbi:MAG: cold shock domain-containing protein [Planctomycetota bacterium]|nr:cold shock domain-containing protein [Planctomycetota bacterium]